MKIRFILLLVVIVFAIFIYTGNRNAEQKIEIDNCSATFYTEPATVTSDLCATGKTCIAGPYEQQNNAVVDVLLCACEKAKAENYAGGQLNSKIENLAAGFFKKNVTADILCEQQAILVKLSYG